MVEYAEFIFFIRLNFSFETYTNKMRDRRVPVLAGIRRRSTCYFVGIFRGIADVHKATFTITAIRGTMQYDLNPGSFREPTCFYSIAINQARNSLSV